MNKINDGRTLAQVIDDVINSIPSHRLEKTSLAELEASFRQIGQNRYVSNQIRKKIKRARQMAVQALQRASQVPKPDRAIEAIKMIDPASAVIAREDLPRPPEVLEQEPPKTEIVKQEPTKVLKQEPPESPKLEISTYQVFLKYFEDLGDRGSKICVEEAARDLTRQGYDFSDDANFFRLRQAFAEFKSRNKVQKQPSVNKRADWSDLPDSEAKRKAERKVSLRMQRREIIEHHVATMSEDDLKNPKWDQIYEELRAYGLRICAAMARESKKAVENRLAAIAVAKIETPIIFKKKEEPVVKTTSAKSNDNEEAFTNLVADMWALCDNDFDLLSLRFEEEIEKLRKLEPLMRRLLNRQK